MNSTDDIVYCTQRTFYKLTNAERQAFYPGYFIISLAILFGNSLVLRAFFSDHRLRTPSNYFLLSLSISDIFLVPVVIGLIVINEVNDYIIVNNSNWSCLILVVFSISLPMTSVLSVTCIAVERYISVFYPLKHLKWVTPRRALTTVIMIWCFAHIIALPSFVLNDVPGKACDVGVLLKSFLAVTVYPIDIGGLLLTVILYSLIFCRAIKQSRKMIDLLSTITSQKPAGQHNSVVSKKKSNESKVTIMAAMVIGLLLLTWIPILIVSAIKQCKESKLFHIVSKLCEMLYFSNLFMNPIVYQCRSKDFRRAFKKILNFKSVIAY